MGVSPRDAHRPVTDETRLHGFSCVGCRHLSCVSSTVSARSSQHASQTVKVVPPSVLVRSTPHLSQGYLLSMSCVGSGWCARSGRPQTRMALAGGGLCIQTTAPFLAAASRRVTG